MLAQTSSRLLVPAILVSILALGVFGVDAVRSRSVETVSAATGGQPMIIPHVLNVNCVSVASISSTYVKLTDVGTFPVQSPGSIIEATWNGRIGVDTLPAGTGAVFELRIDDAASAVGRARANMRRAEVLDGQYPNISVTGIFRDLSAGDHTVSIWVRTSAGGNGTGARVDPGCWSTDHIVIKEYTPFGLVLLPAVLNE
jgi:hypothetical protein